tara:strand:- start:436 stop:885 length:450 start_codon:yes stop_codon:yes gene_type:complete
MSWEDTLKKNYTTTILLGDFIDFLQYGNDNPFLKITKEGVEVKEPLEVKKKQDEDAGYAIIKDGEILVEGISFAIYSLEIYKSVKPTSRDFLNYDGYVEYKPISMDKAEQAIYYFFTKKPKELKKFYEYHSYDGHTIQEFKQNIFEHYK